MKNIVYDNLYKFLVSLGLILIIFPIAAFVYIYSVEPVLISKEEYDLLSDISRNMLFQKQSFTSAIINLPSWIYVSILVFGMTSLCVGLIEWWKIQKELDKKLVAEAGKLNLEFQQMTNQEKKDKVKEEILSSISNDVAIEGSDITKDEKDSEDKLMLDHEVCEDSNETNSQNVESSVSNDLKAECDEAESDNVKNNQSDREKTEEKEIQEYHFKANDMKSRIDKYMQVEDWACRYFQKTYGYDYTFSHNVSINRFYYDIIGVSKYSNMDLIIEIKYNNNKSINFSYLSRSLDALCRARMEYEMKTKRNNRAILMIITDEDLQSQRRIRIQKFYEERGYSALGVDLLFMDLNTLEKMIE